MQFGREKRGAVRVSREVPVEYTPYRLLLSRLESTSFRGKCVDVSLDERGLSFVTSRPLFTGRKLRVVTDGAVRSAVVRWVGAVPEGYRVGVALGDEPSAARQS